MYLDSQHDMARRSLLYHSKSTSITHTTLAHPLHLTTPLIPHEPEIPNALSTILLAHYLDRSHDNADRVTTADSVAVLWYNTLAHQHRNTHHPHH